MPEEAVYQQRRARAGSSPAGAAGQAGAGFTRGLVAVNHSTPINLSKGQQPHRPSHRDRCLLPRECRRSSQVPEAVNVRQGKHLAGSWLRRGKILDKEEEARMKAKPKGGPDTTQVFPLQTAAWWRSLDSVTELMEAFGCCSSQGVWGHLCGGDHLLPPLQGLPRNTASPDQQ